MRVLLEELPRRRLRLPRAVRRRHPRRALGRDGRRDGRGRERARRPGRRADGHGLPVHARGDRGAARSRRCSSRPRSRPATRSLLESGPGHATRCLPSPFVEQFEAERRRLRDAGLDAEELRGRLEQLNIGRLRVAAKGVDRGAGERARAGAAASSSSVAPSRAVGAGHVHDRPGRRAARRGHDASPSCTARSRTGSSELLGEPARRPSASAEPAAAAARGRRDRRPRLHPPRRARRGDASGRTSSTKVDAITRGPGRALGLAADVRPRPERAATRSTRAGAASSTPCRSTRSRSGCRRSRWSRSSRSSCWRCCAPRPRSTTPATRRGRSTASAPR